MNSNQHAFLLRQMIRRRHLTIYRLADRIGVSRVTMGKVIKDPLKMSGYLRRKVSCELGVPVEVIDALINGNGPTKPEHIELVMQLIKPIPPENEQME